MDKGRLYQSPSVPVPNISVSADRLLLPSAPRPRGAITNIALLLNAGYMVAGRTFAYLGFPGFYPGELLVLLTNMRRRDGLWDTYVKEFRLRPFLPLAISLFLLWGFVECLRGYLEGYPLLEVMRGLATHYYPLLLFGGMGMGSRLSPAFIEKYFTFVNILTGVAMLMSVSISSDYGFLPWTINVPIIPTPAIPCFTLVLAIALADRITIGFAISILLGAIATLTLGRGPILGAIAGVLLFLCTRLRKRNKRVLFFLGASGLVYTLLTFTVPALIPDVGGRAGSLNPSRVAARVVSVFDKDLAYAISTQSGEDPLYLDIEAGNADWRRIFWNTVIDSLDSSEDWLVGHGHGFSLGTLMPLALGVDSSVRTPHNFAVFLLGYTGIIGLILYGLLVLAFATEVSRCPPSKTRTAIAAGGVAIAILALSENCLETPIGAVPTYLTMGILLRVARRGRTTIEVYR